MNCPICSKNNWKNIDHLRLKKVDMCICESCGFVSYPSKYKTEDEIKDHYRKSYRNPPQASALFTGERKLQYHEFFLKNIFDTWKELGLESPVVGEIGAAYGLLLNSIRQKFPNADIHGTELTQTYRRVAYHEFGLDLKEDFDTSKKYDLIISYHVLEHQLDPDKKMQEYVSCLKDNGLFYLACPIWFRDAHCGAVGNFDIDDYWAPDHINSWSEEHLEHLLHKAGLEIIYKNDDIYGNTYILKKATKPYVSVKFDAEKYLKIAERMFKAFIHIQENNHAMAIETYSNCPSAWVGHYEFNRANFHKNKEELDKYLDQAIEACPNTSDALMFAADVLTRYERYDDAYEKLIRAMAKKPNSPNILLAMANCFRKKAEKEKDSAKRDRFLKESININRFLMNVSTEFLPQAISWAYYDESQLETPLEKVQDVPVAAV